MKQWLATTFDHQSETMSSAVDAPMQTAEPNEPVVTVEETSFGTWLRSVDAEGKSFREFTSHVRLFGLPLVHVTAGVSPETGKRVTAKGVIAFGRRAIGFVAVGQVAWGVVAVGQLALGFAFGFGQAATGVIAVGQLAVSILFALGQAAVGFVAIGQFGWGTFVLAQLGIGDHVWDTRNADPIARRFFGWWLR